MEYKSSRLIKHKEGKHLYAKGVAQFIGEQKVGERFDIRRNSSQGGFDIMQGRQNPFSILFANPDSLNMEDYDGCYIVERQEILDDRTMKNLLDKFECEEIRLE